MKIFCAIDIVEGKCVRLLQGDFDKQTIYNEDPVAQAKIFEDAGADYIHIVDLDAARLGTGSNREIIANICKSVSAFVQVGGGVRSAADAKALFEIGVKRAVVGTIAVKEPDKLKEMSEQIPLAVSLDAKEGELAVEGWVKSSGVKLVDHIKFLLSGLSLENQVSREQASKALSALIVTDISTDGMLSGPNLPLMIELVELLNGIDNSKAVAPELIASGGVASLDDLKQLKNIGVSGAIVGKALYEGKISPAEAIKETS